MAGKTSLTENIVLIVILAVVLGVTVVPIVWNHFKKASVISTGVEAVARIVSVTDTGKRFNTNPVVTIKLTVTAQDGKEFEAVTTGPVSPVKLAVYKEGTEVRVKYDPEKKEKVAIIDADQAGK